MRHDFNHPNDKNGNTSHLDICKVPAGVRVTVTTRGGVTPSEVSTLSGWYDPADAPAIALAILEAGGHRPVAYDPERLSGNDLLAYIAHRLAVHVSDEAKRTKEAADRKALEAEAEKFLHVLFPFSDGSEKECRFSAYGDDAQKQGVELAMAARELHGGTK